MDGKTVGRIYHSVLAMAFCSSEITRYLYCPFCLVNYIPYFSSNFTALGNFSCPLSTASECVLIFWYILLYVCVLVLLCTYMKF